MIEIESCVFMNHDPVEWFAKPKDEEQIFS